MRKARRIRPVLLLLLWAWALTMFMVIDLFRNVPAFDRIRPTARIYRQMRYAGHLISGEPIDTPLGPDRPLAAPPEPVTDPDLAEINAELDELETDWLDPLAAEYIALGKLFGPDARNKFLDVIGNEAREVEVRAQAAWLLGATGPGASAALGRLLGKKSLPIEVRRGAARGLGEANDPEAAERALSLVGGELDAAARFALRRMDSDKVAGRLCRILEDDRTPPQAGLVACRVLARFPNDQAIDTLVRTARNARAGSELRCAAAAAIGRSGRQDAAPLLASLASDADAALAKTARQAAHDLAPWLKDG